MFAVMKSKCARILLPKSDILHLFRTDAILMKILNRFAINLGGLADLRGRAPVDGLRSITSAPITTNRSIR